MTVQSDSADVALAEDEAEMGSMHQGNEQFPDDDLNEDYAVQQAVRYRLQFEDHVFKRTSHGRHFVAGMLRKSGVPIDEAIFHFRNGKPIGSTHLEELQPLLEKRSALLNGRQRYELSPAEKAEYQALGQQLYMQYEKVTTPIVRWWSSGKTIEITGLGPRGVDLVDENIIPIIRAVKAVCGETPRMSREFMEPKILDKGADDLQSYNIRSLVLSHGIDKYSMTLDSWQASSEEDRRAHILRLIWRGIDAQCTVLGLLNPISEEDISILEYSAGERINAINASHSWDGRHQPTVMLSDVFVKMPFELRGIWQCGYFVSRGNGRINFLGRGDAGFDRIRNMAAYEMRNKRGAQ